MSMTEKNVDYYHATNSDFSGERTIEEERHEIVEHRGGYAMRIWYNDQDAGFDTHWHTDMEIIMPIEGWYEVTVEDAHFHIEPDDILIIPSGALHSIVAPEQGTRFIFLLDISSIASIRSFSEIEAILSSPLHVTRSAFPLIYGDIHSILEQIRNEYFDKAPFYELTIFSLLINMFVLIGKDHLRSLETSSQSTHIYKQHEYVNKFNDIMAYIDEHYMEDLTLDSISSAAGFSRYHFSRLFKQYTGFTFCAYISHRRIKAAEKLLEQSNLSVTEIAMRSGFPSISTFNRVFRQQKNCSPTEYREKHDNQGMRSRKREAL